MSDALAFLKAFVTTPQRIGAIAPSSAALARCMVSESQIGEGDVVVELGAGTGPVTRALAEMHPGVRTLALEPDAALAARCREAAPSIEVLESFAQELPSLLADRGWGRASRVVSSLPFAGWPAQLQDDVFDAIFEATTDDARMVTFTYGHSRWLPAGKRTRAVLESRFSSVRATPMVWGNLPPALVYVCER